MSFDTQEALEIIAPGFVNNTGSPIAWVIFEHGTVFLTTINQSLPFDSNADQLSAVATQTLIRARPQENPHNIDFEILPLQDYYPDLGRLHMVNYYQENGLLHEDLLHIFASQNYIDPDNYVTKSKLGMHMREHLLADLEQVKIRIIRLFDGTITNT